MKGLDVEMPEKPVLPTKPEMPTPPTPPPPAEDETIAMYIVGSILKWFI